MEKEKIILLFSDLEGTILRESDGQYDDADMYEFLKQIDELQTITGASVKLHLVSPVSQKIMQQILDKIDRNINSYNKINRSHKDIAEIECAGAYTDDKMISEEFLGDRIIPLKKPVSIQLFDTARYGKADYVNNWIETYNDSHSKELAMCIYCGNGRNDISAMSMVNATKGYVVCPKNSRTKAKEIAFHVSNMTDLRGITDGIESINNELLKGNNQEDNSNKISDIEK